MTMMECGHAANATTRDGKPVCAICHGHPGSDVVRKTLPDLTGRKAICTSARPLDEQAHTLPVPSSINLAFFEYRGPGNTSRCRHCPYADVAHVRFTEPGRTWPRGIKPHAFEAKTEGEEFDHYYCGCQGWN